jgi:hypothetical protein
MTQSRSRMLLSLLSASTSIWLARAECGMTAKGRFDSLAGGHPNGGTWRHPGHSRSRNERYLRPNHQSSVARPNAETPHWVIDRHKTTAVLECLAERLDYPSIRA